MNEPSYIGDKFKKWCVFGAQLRKTAEKDMRAWKGMKRSTRVIKKGNKK